MPDHPYDDAQVDELARQARAASGELQLQFLTILNGGQWAHAPHVAAHACLELTAQVLRAVVLRNPNDEGWALEMVNHLQRAVLSVRGETPGDAQH